MDMVAITYDMEIPSSVVATKMFKAVVLDDDTFIPKIMPQAIKNVEILGGDGGVGTMKLIHFRESSKHKSVKHCVDALNFEKLMHTYRIVESDVLIKVLESITNRIKIVPTENEGCICNNRSIYHTNYGIEISEEKIKEGKEKAMVMFEAIEAYLQANPDA